MLVWILLILLAIIVIIILCFYNYNIDPNIPTIHAQCHENNSCGGDLTCDTICHRCKKKIGGNCAGDVDCETGLRCINWKCSLSDKVKPEEKHVKWDSEI